MSGSRIAMTRYSPRRLLRAAIPNKRSPRLLSVAWRPGMMRASTFPHQRLSPSLLLLAAAALLALAVFLAPGARPAQAQDTVGNCQGTATMSAAEQHADLLWRMTNQGESEASARQGLERFCTGLYEMFERFPTGLSNRERILWRGTIWIGNVPGGHGCHDRAASFECPDDATFTLKTPSGLDSPYKIRSIRTSNSGPLVSVTFSQAIPDAYRERFFFYSHAPFRLDDIGDGRAAYPLQVGGYARAGRPGGKTDYLWKKQWFEDDGQGFRGDFQAVGVGWPAGSQVSVALTLMPETAGQQAAPRITVTAANPLGVSEDGSGAYTVVLDSEPVVDVTVTATSSDAGAVSVSPASHTFTPSNWHEPATFTVSGVADDDTNDESVGVSHLVTSQDSRYEDVLVPSVQVTVSDTTQDQQQQTSTNSAPTVSASIADVTIVNESGTTEVSLSGVFSDADNDALTVTAASSDTGKATVSVAADHATLTVTAKARGTATVTVTADDGNGGTVADSFIVTVKAAPVVASAIADATMTIESFLDVSLSGVFSDADGDALTVTAASSDGSVAEAILFQGTLTLLSVKEGSATITVTAEDADGNTVSDAFEVSVTPEPKDYSALIAKVREWRNDPQWVDNKTHTDRWDRVLVALGETVADTSLTAMTAAEAQGYADRGWQRWVSVVKALTEIESG